MVILIIRVHPDIILSEIIVDVFLLILFSVAIVILTVTIIVLAMAIVIHSIL